MYKNKYSTNFYLLIRVRFFIFMLFAAHNSMAQVKYVWALGDGEKVFRNEDSHPDKNKNNIWDGKTIRLKGLYNEVLAFQVIIETDKQGAKAVEINVDAPVEKISSYVIGGNTLKYGPQGTIEVFSEHYLHVIDSTQPNWFYGSLAAQPAHMNGWIPDALIPVNALPGMGGLPLDIPAVNSKDKHFKNRNSQNQGFWIDIYLPRDRNFPPGIYYGKVQVFQEGKLVKELPLEITLLSQYLPDENYTNVWLFNSRLESYFTGMSESNLDKMIKFEAHRHRIDMAGGFEVNSSPFSQVKMDSYKPYLDGTGFTPANGYNGPGEGAGERLFPIGMYGADIMGNSKEEVQKQADLWVGWFRNNAPDKTFFWYIKDEPGKSAYPWIKERAEWIKSNAGPGKLLPVFTTSSYLAELAGAIDIWAAFDGVELNKLQEVRKNGGDYWFYNGNRPRIGSVILEGTAVDFRINSWILYKYGIKEWFIWEGTHWQHNSQGPKARLHQNVFTCPLTFINQNMEFGNGDGILFYPGRMPFYPDQDRGLNQLLPSMRLKNIRRGQQDALIMWLAEQKVGREKVISIISKVLPKAMSEVDMKDKVPWSEHGSDYDAVRDELLNLLNQ
jgi:hypothetical protein